MSHLRNCVPIQTLLSQTPTPPKKERKEEKNYPKIQTIEGNNSRVKTVKFFCYMALRGQVLHSISSVGVYV